MPLDREHAQLVFRKLSRQLAKLGAKPQPGIVHQFRTYSRRLQVLLEELTPELSRNDKRLLKLLRRLRRRAGRVRDLDVQIAALRSLKIPQEPRRKAQLLGALAEMRIQREKKLSQSLDRKTIREVSRRLKKTENSHQIPAGVEPLQVARRILSEISKPKAPLTEEVLHQYRIAGKRVRYVTELAGQVPEAEPFTNMLKGMQDALGDWHDWLLLSQSAEKILGNGQDSALLSALRNITGAKFRHALQLVSEMRATFLSKPATPAETGASPQTPTASLERRPMSNQKSAVRAATA
jgi:CHAD domain-containing protein